ncbi:MAG: hypothetical protein IPK82_29705 [Polyangiaceae bacterium]|nr:hypothetical protein [Polyangiaceae bacterium]
MEEQHDCLSYEEALNKALEWMDQLGGPIGPYYNIEIGRLGAGLGMEVGVSSSVDPFRRVRLGFDPFKGPHFNVDAGKGTGRRKAALRFPGTEETISQQFKRRKPRNG